MCMAGQRVSLTITGSGLLWCHYIILCHVIESYCFSPFPEQLPRIPLMSCHVMLCCVMLSLSCYLMFQSDFRDKFRKCPRQLRYLSCHVMLCCIMSCYVMLYSRATSATNSASVPAFTATARRPTNTSTNTITRCESSRTIWRRWWNRVRPRVM